MGETTNTKKWSLIHMETIREVPEYKPSEHRVVKRPISYFETFIHLVKASIGSGILAMPHAFYKAGYITAIIGTCLIGLLCTYCIRTLVAVQYELCVRYEKPSFTYQETTETAMMEGPACGLKLHKPMGFLSNVFVLMFQVGCGCIYLIFVSKNIKMMTEHFTEMDNGIYIYMVFVVICLCCAESISDLKYLAWLGFIATVSTMVSFVLSATFIFREVPSFENRSAFGKPQDLPLFIGTVVFSMEAVGAVIPLENEMKHPEEFTSTCGVVHAAMVPTVALYIVVGLLGYLKYGDAIQGSITLNLPVEESLSHVCITLMVIGIFTTNVQVIFITYKILWNSFIGTGEFKYNDNVKYFCQYGIRVFLVLFTFCLALIVPNLELLISLIGSLCLATAGIAFPALLNLFTYWNDYTKGNFVVFFIWCSLIIVLAAFVCTIGVYVSLVNIYKDIWSKML